MIPAIFCASAGLELDKGMAFGWVENIRIHLLGIMHAWLDVSFLMSWHMLLQDYIQRIRGMNESWTFVDILRPWYPMSNVSYQTPNAVKRGAIANAFRLPRFQD